MLLAHHRERRSDGAAERLPHSKAVDPWARRRELQQKICLALSNAGLRPHKGTDHVLVLETIADARGGAGADVNSIYKMLCDVGQPFFMSKLYRVLKALEQIGLLERRWEDKQGRVRSVYRVPGQVEAAHPPSRLICRSCGSATHSSSATLGREIATAARQGGLPIADDAVVVYVSCAQCSPTGG